MIRITQLKLPITHTEEQLHRKIAKTLRLGNQPFTYEIRKQSLDARHKEDKKFVYTVDIKVDNESRVLKKVHDKNIMLTAERKYHFPTPGSETSVPSTGSDRKRTGRIILRLVSGKSRILSIGTGTWRRSR